MLFNRINDVHYIGGIRAQLKVCAWYRELEFETDDVLREFIRGGVTNGFAIVDEGAVVINYFSQNVDEGAGVINYFSQNVRLTWLLIWLL